MTRFLVDIPQEDLRWLDRTAAEQGTSRAALLRQAVAAFREQDKDWLEKGFGLWAKYGFTEDGLEYQNRLREEWVREWDPDYDPARHGPLPDEKDAAE
jgi:hypothetical protein